MSLIERSPWICPCCAHFIVRPTAPEDAPSHDCEAASGRVDLVPYIDSTQALQIRNSLDTVAYVRAAARRDS